MAKHKVNGKVTIKAYTGGAGCAGAFMGFHGPANNNFVGPSLQQRLQGYAAASTLVTVSLEGSSFRGRVISVDGNAFDITVIDPGTSIFTPGAIVTVNFWQVNAISAGAY